MLSCTWPPALLAHERFEEMYAWLDVGAMSAGTGSTGAAGTTDVSSTSAGGERQQWLIYRGFRLKAGVHIGPLNAHVSPTTGEAGWGAAGAQCGVRVGDLWLLTTDSTCVLRAYDTIGRRAISMYSMCSLSGLQSKDRKPHPAACQWHSTPHTSHPVLAQPTGKMSYRGRAMNAAARIMATATAGRVICSRQCWDAAGDQLQPSSGSMVATSRGHVQLKGLSEQVRGFITSLSRCCVAVTGFLYLVCWIAVWPLHNQ